VRDSAEPSVGTRMFLNMVEPFSLVYNPAVHAVAAIRHRI